MRRHRGSTACGILYLYAQALLVAMPVLADEAPAKSTESPANFWAVCPNVTGYMEEWAHGIFLLSGVTDVRFPKINNYEMKYSFPERQQADWYGNLSAARYIVLIGTWRLGDGFVYTVIDKHDPLNIREGPRNSTMYDFWGAIDGDYQVFSLGSAQDRKLNEPLVVRVFNPETLTISEPGREAWRHVMGDGLVIQEGGLVFRRLPDVPFHVDVADELKIEGKSFKVHWNDGVGRVLATAKPGEPDGLVVISQHEPNGETCSYDLIPRPTAFRVVWPYVLCGYGDETDSDTGQKESEMMVRNWRVLNLESEKWGSFSFETRCQNTGLDIQDDVIFWSIDEELWAVDLQEALEKGTTRPQLVWQNPIVRFIQALFPTQNAPEVKANRPGGSVENRDAE